MRIDKEAIFCAVAAYNETFLSQMIESAFDNSSDPDNLYFGIFNQKSGKQKFEDLSYYSNVRCINAEYDEPLGVGYARLSATMLHRGEKYFSQMDSHNLFCKDWDGILLEDYKLLEKNIEKPILAQSVPGHNPQVYDSQDDLKNIIRSKSYPLKLNATGDTTEDRSREDEERFLGKFLEHHLMMACAEFFTSSEYIYEVSYDPFVMYLPDQELSALRAGSRGYRFFSNGLSVMSHLGKSDDFPEEKFGHDFFYQYNSNVERSKDFYRSSYEIYCYAALLGKRLGFFGAPDKGSYDEYVNKMKVSYDETYRDAYDRIASSETETFLLEEGEEVFFKSIY